AKYLLERLDPFGVEAVPLPHGPVAATKKIIRMRDSNFLIGADDVRISLVVTQNPSLLIEVAANVVADENEARNGRGENRMVGERRKLGSMKAVAATHRLFERRGHSRALTFQILQPILQRFEFRVILERRRRRLERLSTSRNIEL